jgi:ribosomal protein L29
LRDLNDDELANRLANSTRLKLAKREIARILTVQHDRGTSKTRQKVQS